VFKEIGIDVALKWMLQQSSHDASEVLLAIGSIGTTFEISIIMLLFIILSAETIFIKGPRVVAFSTSFCYAAASE